MSIELVILYCQLLPLPSIFPCIRVFYNETVLRIRWPKYWSFNFSITPSCEYSWLISLQIDWFDLPGVQGTLKSLLQHHSSKASVLHIRWPKHLEIQHSISPSSEYSGLISFRMDWLDLLVVLETLKSLLQHHSSKASILQCSAFFIDQLSHPGKTIALTRRTFVGKVMSLFLNMLPRLVIAFLPKCLLISWLHSPSAVTLEPPKNKVSHCFHCFPIYLP